MKKSITILFVFLSCLSYDSYAQGVVTRPKKDKTETQQSEAKRKQEEEAKRKQEEAKRKQEEEAKRKQEAERKKETGMINGHEYVDLGLSVKWATTNIGATTPEGYGSYFAWGETSTKSVYTEENSRTYGKSVSQLQSSGIINPGGILTPSYDAARANWGGTWRMPTKAEFDELLNKCTWTWTSQGGKNGYRVTGSNGKSIFLPAAGYRCGSSLYLAGEGGDYWSSSVFDGTDRAYYLYFNSGSHRSGWSYRYYGRSVRPVSE